MKMIYKVLIVLVFSGCAQAASPSVEDSDAAMKVDGFVDAGDTVQPDADATASPSVEVFTKLATGWTQASRGFWGDPIALRVSGLRPGETVQIEARAGTHHASADFVVPEDGVIDLRRDAPIEGDYEGVDVDGLLWSMTSDDGSLRVDTFSLTYIVTGESELHEEVSFERYWYPEGMRVEFVRENGLRGTFVSPGGDGPFPTLLIVGGSEGGNATSELRATYMASLGYASLALAYFAAPDLPDSLAEIPLEYFETAVDWLKQHERVDPERMGAMGGSRGGELVLLLASRTPELKAIVATAPSGVVWGPAALREPETPAWTEDGLPVPFVPMSDAQPVISIAPDGKPIYAMATTFLDSLVRAPLEAVADALIPLGDSGMPILFLAGEDDQLWAACELGGFAWDQIEKRSDEAAQRSSFHCFDDAGHQIPIPGLPTQNMTRTYLPHANAWLAQGGEPAAIAAAARKADEEIRSFLSDALGE